MRFRWKQSAFLKFAFILLIGLSSVVQADAGEPNSSSPNLIVIMTDEHNFRTLGCYRELMQKRQAYMWGPAVVETPNSDCSPIKVRCVLVFMRPLLCAVHREVRLFQDSILRRHLL